MRDHAIDSANSPWNPPQAFEEYRLVCPLSRGAMGEVYLAHDTLLERPVAIKFIIAMGDNGPSPEVREQFLTEARAAARLQHPNVVTIYRVSEIDKRPLIISEFVRGQNLDSVPKPVPWQRAQELGLGLARGLAAAHRRGVLHLDIKPGKGVSEAGGGANDPQRGVTARRPRSSPRTRPGDWQRDAERLTTALPIRAARRIIAAHGTRACPGARK